MTSITNQGYVLTRSGKTVTQLLLGGVILGSSLLLIVPSALGIAEYNKRPLPIVGGLVDQNKQKQLETYRNIQIAVLVVACIGVVLAGVLMLTSDAAKTKLDVKKQAFPPTSASSYSFKSSQPSFTFKSSQPSTPLKPKAAPVSQPSTPLKPKVASVPPTPMNFKPKPIVSKPKQQSSAIVPMSTALTLYEPK